MFINGLLILIVLFLFNCQSYSQNKEDYFPKSVWRTSTPNEQGLDQAKIIEFIKKLRNEKLQEPITSFLIVKNGYLIVEETFGDYNGEEPHTLQSVTKSIASTLVGVAIQNGFIKSLDQKVLDFFPEYKIIENLNAHKKSMNLQDVLTMRTGQTWTGEEHLHSLNRYDGDRMKYVLDYEMEMQPGKKWYYNSGIAVLLGGLLQNATKMNTKKFAQKYLFDPMNIKKVRWHGDHNGIPHTGGGLNLRPIDMAKIGYLYLRNGMWEDKQLVPDWWVKEATQVHVPNTNFPNVGYGYMWWLMPLNESETLSNNAEIIMAYGHWGQFIFVIPLYDMVVVFTNNSSASYEDELRPVTFLDEYVLPAIRNK